jgi:hypothetical protein
VIAELAAADLTKRQISHILEKLGMRDRVDLTRYAIRCALVERDARPPQSGLPGLRAAVRRSNISLVRPLVRRLK